MSDKSEYASRRYVDTNLDAATKALRREMFAQFKALLDERDKAQAAQIKFVAVAVLCVWLISHFVAWMLR